MKRTNSLRRTIFNFFAAQRNKNNLESDTDSGSASEEINIDLHASEQGEVEQTPNDICIDSSSCTDDLENLQIDELGRSSQPQVPVTTTAFGEYSKPNHPDVKEIPALKRTQAVRFQKSGSIHTRGFTTNRRCKVYYAGHVSKLRVWDCFAAIQRQTLLFCRKASEIGKNRQKHLKVIKFRTLIVLML